jgi:signal transduction histidine kinase
MAEDQSSRLDAAGRHQLERIQAAVRQMWELIGSLVEFSRIGRKAIKLRLVDLEELVAQCVEQVRAETEARHASVHIARPLGAAQADPSLLKIAVCNLLSNAVKYTAPGTEPELKIESRPVDGRIRLFIRDNGIGIRGEDQQRIFTPFVRLHGVEDYPGVGLGLSAARKVIEIMGGQLEVESTPGQGSTFCIELEGGGRE